MARQPRTVPDKQDPEPEKAKPAAAKPAEAKAASAKPAKASAEAEPKAAGKEKAPAKAQAKEKAAPKEKAAKAELPEVAPEKNRAPVEEEVRIRAYAIWVEEGMPHGRDEDHWHRARTELEGDDL